MKNFGPYLIEVDENHCVISRQDGEPAEPTFYEMQHMKCLAFGGPAVAVEVFPAAAQLVDGENQRHLWRMPDDSVPNLRTGHMVEHTK